MENVTNNKIPFIIKPQNVEYMEKIQQKSVYDFERKHCEIVLRIDLAIQMLVERYTMLA